MTESSVKLTMALNPLSKAVAYRDGNALMVEGNLSQEALVETIEKGVFRIYRSLRQQPALKDMSPQDPVLLKQIARRPGIGLGDLAALERLSASTITSHINRLKAAGLVRRVADKTDRRRAGLHITAKGRRGIELATQVRHDFIAERLATLSREEVSILASAASILMKLGDDPAADIEGEALD
jgi:DNA-binding MarR family transcriptional regulator